MKQSLKGNNDALEWLYIPDVVYAEYKNCQRQLQLFVPSRYEGEVKEKLPLLIFIQGSAWHCQEMYNAVPSYAKLAERGFVMAAVQYRESEIAEYPAQVEDVNRAIAYLLCKAEEYHIDTSRIFVAGNSSGGHIALMTALRKANGLTDWKENDAASPNGVKRIMDMPEFEISGVITESAPVDLFMVSEWEDEKIKQGKGLNSNPCKDLFGVKEMAEKRSLVREACCEMYIKEEIKLPPFLLFHGTADETVPVEQSRILYHMLTKANKQAAYYELEDAGHGGAAFWSEAVLDIIQTFTDKACS